MEVYHAFLDKMADLEYRQKLKSTLEWVQENYPELDTVVKWNQPMFTHNGTYIIGFSVSKKHFAIAPEAAGIIHNIGSIEEAGYDYTNNIIRVPWDMPIDYVLLEKLITFNIEDKAECSTFWRK
ncbi:iron chaperone [Salinicoccus sesuvii]|uniref:Iron chaperone n=1 Tax=Salinicoccus sesuvii TaxID=868281 RepID=A0ABV7N7E8_9STAP